MTGFGLEEGVSRITAVGKGWGVSSAGCEAFLLRNVDVAVIVPLFIHERKCVVVSDVESMLKMRLPSAPHAKNDTLKRPAIQ